MLHGRAIVARTACVGLACLSLAGCFTPRAHPEPSAAVLEARAHRNAPPPAACPQTEVASISPLTVGFDFDSAELNSAGGRQADRAAAWLACNPGFEAVILPAADAHGGPEAQQALASARAKAVADRIRAKGAQNVIRTRQAGAAAPEGGAALVIRAQGQGW